MEPTWRSLALILTLMSRLGMAVVDIGDDAPNLCWNRATGQEFCLHDFDKQIRALIYTDGHTPACAALVQGLANRAREVADQKVTFIVLSTEGKKPGSPPSRRFLTSWWSAFDSLPANFVVGASPFDAGTSFYELPNEPPIPNVVLVNAEEELAFVSATSPSVDEVLTEIKKLKPEASAPSPSPSPGPIPHPHPHGNPHPPPSPEPVTPPPGPDSF